MAYQISMDSEGPSITVCVQERHMTRVCVTPLIGELIFFQSRAYRSSTVIMMREVPSFNLMFQQHIHHLRVYKLSCVEM